MYVATSISFSTNGDNMRNSIILFFIALTTSSFASTQCEPWTITLEFKMQGAGYTDTVAWIGGWASAVININGNNSELGVCTPECGYYVSKAIVDLLNEKFKGQTISAETASAAIWPALKTRLPCQQTAPSEGNVDRSKMP